jgi:hypothetical protein
MTTALAGRLLEFGPAPFVVHGGTHKTVFGFEKLAESCCQLRTIRQ